MCNLLLTYLDSILCVFLYYYPCLSTSNPCAVTISEHISCVIDLSYPYRRSPFKITLIWFWYQLIIKLKISFHILINSYKIRLSLIKKWISRWIKFVFKVFLNNALLNKFYINLHFLAFILYIIYIVVSHSVLNMNNIFFVFFIYYYK